MRHLRSVGFLHIQAHGNGPGINPMGHKAKMNQKQEDMRMGWKFGERKVERRQEDEEGGGIGVSRVHRIHI